MFSRRIWKTGALAVAVTLIFGLLITGLGEWTQGLQSGFVPYGQTGSGGSGGTGTSGTTTTKIIPQVAVGSYDGGLTTYSTVIQIINSGSVTATVSVNFYNENGSASTLTMRSGSSTFTGALSNVSIPLNGITVITADTAPLYTAGWAKVTSSSALTINTVFEQRDGTNVLLGRVGVAPSDADMSRFVVPRMRNVATTLDTGFALVNTGTASATVTATLLDNAGATLSTKSQALTGGQHIAAFASQFFILASEPAGTNYHFMLFSSTSPQFAATALAYEGSNVTSFPVNRLQ